MYTATAQTQETNSVIENNNPKYRGAGAVRLDAIRRLGENWDDAGNVVSSTFMLYKLLFDALSPYNAKQLGSNKPYVPPSMDYLKAVVKRRPSTVNQITFDNMLQSVRRFTEEHKTNKQLAYPDPVTLHSAHFPEGTFSFEEITVTDWIKAAGTRPYLPSSVHRIDFAGLGTSVYVENYRPDNHKYIILRPKLSKLGVPLIANWEALFFKKNHGFFLDRVDADINPRYCGLSVSRGRSR